MRIRYFQDTDTSFIEFRPSSVKETRDLDEKPCSIWIPTATSVVSRSNVPAARRHSAFLLRTNRRLTLSRAHGIRRCQGIEWTPHPFTAAIEYMCIDHGGTYVLMPEKFLDSANVVRIFK